MKRAAVVLAVCAIAFAPSAAAVRAAVPSPAPGKVFHVAADGAGDGDGSEARPLASLEQARDAIRGLKKAGPLPAGGVTVLVRGGVYPRTATFELAAEDSGTPDAPVVYRARARDEVRLTGGRAVTNFRPVTDAAVLERLDPAARGHVVEADLKALGVTDFGDLRVRGFGKPVVPAALELFFQDRPMPLARWPNDGWTRIAAVPAGPQGGKFTYEGDRPARWAKADDLWLHGYWTQDWADSYVKVRSIDPAAREIATVEPHGVYGYKAKQRYRALNVLEELDEPGEWHLDRPRGLLYFWPPAPLDQGRACVSLAGTLVAVRGASDVTLRGFILECARGTAVDVRDSTRVTLAGCTLRNLGNRAVDVTGGRQCAVVGCDIYETGDGGISLSGGDRATLAAAGHAARNNHIHHYSRWCRTYRPAIGLGGVGQQVSHNLIHDGPHCGILFGGNEHVLEFNEIHRVCAETGDVGAFYIGRDWTMRGNVIRHNFFHDIHGPGTYGANSVYLDDGASGTTIFGNVFVRASRGAFVGGGRDNVIENNIFVDCEPAVHIDARGIGWARQHIATDGDWQMYRKLQAVHFDRPPYAARYPKLAAILQEEPARPLGNVVARNVSVGGKWLDLQGVDKAWVRFDSNLTEGDPGFVDAARMNFQLKAESPAWKLGFRRIPFEKIGLEVDEYRPTLPPGR